MPPRDRGERRTPAAQAAWVEAKFGVGSPPPVPPALEELARALPDEPLLHLEEARAAVAAAESAGLRLTSAFKVTRPPQETPPTP